MSSFRIIIDRKSSVPRYRQIINQVEDAVGSGSLESGDRLPSVNQLIKSLNVSRDTIFKAYEQLKNRGVVESVQSKAYFIREGKIRILLFLDKFSPFKEGLYEEMRKNLPENFSIDLYFHHYNPEVFSNVLENGKGRYNYFVIMSFENDKISAILENMDKRRVLILDVRHGAPAHLPRIYQDFGESFYNCLQKTHQKLLKYREILFVLRPETHHPRESAIAFINFCSDYGIRGKILDELRDEDIQREVAYIVVSDDDLVRVVEKSYEQGYQTGKDIGLISYNDTPVKKVITGGITVISTDFRDMGYRAANFLKSPGYINTLIPTSLIERKSL
ncbi:MAG: GntR family transcriptional regulator [Bacteroidota bacterium]